MNENTEQQIASAAERLAAAAEALSAAMGRIEAQQQDLSVKIDRIIAAIDERAELEQLQQRIRELERENGEVKAQAHTSRKTMPAFASMLLSKGGVDERALDNSTIDKALGSLSVEQRVAVKAEMARAGLIE